MSPSLSSGFEMALLRMVSFLPGEVKENKKKVQLGGNIGRPILSLKLPRFFK